MHACTPSSVFQSQPDGRALADGPATVLKATSAPITNMAARPPMRCLPNIEDHPFLTVAALESRWLAGLARNSHRKTDATYMSVGLQVAARKSSRRHGRPAPAHRGSGEVSRFRAVASPTLHWWSYRSGFCVQCVDVGDVGPASAWPVPVAQATCHYACWRYRLPCRSGAPSTSRNDARSSGTDSVRNCESGISRTRLRFSSRDAATGPPLMRLRVR